MTIVDLLEMAARENLTIQIEKMLLFDPNFVEIEVQRGGSAVRIAVDLRNACFQNDKIRINAEVSERLTEALVKLTALNEESQNNYVEKENKNGT